MLTAPSGGTGHLAGTLGYFTAALLWGLNLPLTAALLKHFDPYWVSPLRYVMAGVLLASMVAAMAAASPRLAALRSPVPLARVAVMGLAVAGFLVLYNVGLYLSHPVTVAAISAGSPVYVAVVSRLMTGAPLARGFWGATALTLTGAAIAIHGRAQATGQAFHLGWGEPLVVLSIGSWTAYSILAQRWFTPDVPQLRRTWLSTAGALPWLLLAWALARALGLAGPPNLEPAPAAWGQLVVAAVFCTALATVAWNIGVSRLGIQTGGVWQNTVPVFAVLISWLFFGITPLTAQLAGGALVLAGVVYMQWRRRRP
jgi:drug/metabolite transporter (DMT)-like permease